MAEDKSLRESLVEYARRLSSEGLNVNSSGNLSVRSSFTDQLEFLITPSALAYEKMVPEDIVRMIEENDTFRPKGILKPSSEWLLHSSIYQARGEVQAVVHTHSPFATALSCLEEAIPPFHYMIAQTGGSEILCAPYATFGSRELAERCVETLGKHRKACLMSHHGVLSLGSSLEEAFSIAREVENLAMMWLNLKKLGGCRMIDKQEMDKVKQKFLSYKQ